MLTVSIKHPDSESFIDAKLEEGKVIYRIYNESGKAIIDNCLLEYK